MRLICGVAVALAAALIAGPVAAVDISPLPLPVPVPTLPPPPTMPVPLPTVPAPPVPAPPVPAPPVSPPPVPAPSPVPPPVTPPSPATPTPAPAPAPAAQPAATTPSRATAAPAASAALQPRSQTPAASPSSAPRRASYTPSAQRTPAARPILRPIVAHFKLAKPGRLHVRVLQLSPVCRRLGSFPLNVHSGKNTLRLPKRIHSLGTYLLTGRRGLETVFTFRARLLRGRHVALGGGDDACVMRVEAAAISATPALTTPSAKSQTFKPPPQERRSAAPKAIAGSPRNSSPLVRAVTLNDAPAGLRPLLFVLLAISIGLLGIAAMPQRVLPAGPVAAAIARRRLYLAAAGIWILAVVAVVTTFS